MLKICAKLLAFITLVLIVIATAGTGIYKIMPGEIDASIRGKVTFKGTVPPPKEVLINKDNEICGTGNREIQWVKLANGGGLRNVALYIVDIDKNKNWEKSKNGFFLNQRGCRFIPNFFAVPKGEKLRVLNSDPMLHNVHAYEVIGRIQRTMFNVGQPKKGLEFTKHIRTRRGNIVKIECDAHNFMQAWIFVPENPYFDLVNEWGEYAIDDIPAGTYTVRAWHPTLGVKESKIRLAAGQNLTLNFEFSIEKRN